MRASDLVLAGIGGGTTLACGRSIAWPRARWRRRRPTRASTACIPDAVGGRPGDVGSRRVAIGRRRQFVATCGAGALVAGAAFGAVGAAFGLLLVVAGRLVVVRSGRRRRARAMDEALPDLVDLFALAASAGLPVLSALPVVAARAPPILADVVRRSAGLLARGSGIDEALVVLDRGLGPDARELVAGLHDAVHTGAPLAPALAVVSSTVRDRRRRAAEERARRLPVTLLFPLAACVLPAAVLLAIVPVLVASLGSLGLSGH